MLVSCRCRLTSPFDGHFCLPKDFFICARALLSAGGVALAVPARSPFSRRPRARASRPESWSFVGCRGSLKKEESPPSGKATLRPAGGGARLCGGRSFALGRASAGDYLSFWVRGWFRSLRSLWGCKAARPRRPASATQAGGRAVLFAKIGGVGGWRAHGIKVLL